jgi:hypothetical protein
VIPSFNAINNFLQIGAEETIQGDQVEEKNLLCLFVKGEEMSTAKKLIVCGGNGFLGSRICKSAVARGWDVTSIRYVKLFFSYSMNSFECANRELSF